MRPNRLRQATEKLPFGREETFVSERGNRLAGASASRRRRQTIAAIGLGILLAAALTAVAAAEKPTTVKAGNLVLTINGGVTPKALPKKEMAPITLNVAGKIGTADGTHPPALRRSRRRHRQERHDRRPRGPDLQAGPARSADHRPKQKSLQAGDRRHRHHRRRGRIRRIQTPIPIKSKLLAFNGGDQRRQRRRSTSTPT